MVTKIEEVLDEYLRSLHSSMYGQAWSINRPEDRALCVAALLKGPVGKVLESAGLDSNFNRIRGVSTGPFSNDVRYNPAKP